MSKRTSTSFMLLLLWMIPQGFGLLCDIRKWDIKQQQQHRHHATLVTLHLQAADVRWMDKKEIFVGGRMFDLVDSKLENGIYTFTGAFDDAETELVWLQQQSTGQEQDQSLLTHLFQYLQQLYHEQPEPGRLPESPVAQSFPLHTTSLRTGILDVSTPPPQRTAA